MQLTNRSCGDFATLRLHKISTTQTLAQEILWVARESQTKRKT